MNGKKIGGWIVRGGIAAEGCSSMGAGSIGGKNYCGNLLWQSSLTLLPRLHTPRARSVSRKDFFTMGSDPIVFNSVDSCSVGAGLIVLRK